eukprot:TRINITY_DN3010_c0_g1_i1.p1 TRINITY_DN3010_c0_g1~~TRINITY_DN3010_c0_g1_i1.p1  ORF type:complete len:500 (-),score=164.18 TRINITY_DN3010_c0_g1_i1:162-1661(-)
MEELSELAERKKKCYVSEKDSDWNRAEREADRRKLRKEKMLEAGQSKRIWDELYKVVDASDIILEVVDARDPMGTRTTHVEEHIKKNCPHKHIVLIINKCDLVPTKVTAHWVKLLSKEYPTVAFKASVTNPFGKATLIQLLKQFDALHKDKKTISIGFVGYPNVGKSSVINTLKKRGVCKVAPIPGETKVWQYVALTKRIYLIDCPGIVYDEGQSATDIVLKGVVRAEKIEGPEEYIDEVLKRVKKETFEKLYNVRDWADAEDFLKMVAERFGKLKKGGEPHSDLVARMILNDWQRGKIPYFVPPPFGKAEAKEEEKDIDELQPEAKLEEDNLEEIKEELKANAEKIEEVKDSNDQMKDINNEDKAEQPVEEPVVSAEEMKDETFKKAITEVDERKEAAKENEAIEIGVEEAPSSRKNSQNLASVNEVKEVAKDCEDIKEPAKDNLVQEYAFDQSMQNNAQESPKDDKKEDEQMNANKQDEERAEANISKEAAQEVSKE